MQAPIEFNIVSVFGKAHIMFGVNEEITTDLAFLDFNQAGFSLYLFPLQIPSTHEN